MVWLSLLTSLPSLLLSDLRELLLQAVQDRSVAIVGSDQLDFAVIYAVVGNPNLEAVQLRGFAQAFEPFHRRHPGGKQVFAQTKLVDIGLFEPIQVDVIQRQTPLMLLDHGEGGA